jgi:hypothetical protein
MYIHKLLLNVVVAGIEELVSGNKFLYACVKEVHRLGAQLRFDTSINSSLLLKHFDSNHFFKAVRRVVKQLALEMLQQCTSMVTEKHYTGCQHSTPFVLNGRPYTVCFVLRKIHF